jgi:hypothetical protein
MSSGNSKNDRDFPSDNVYHHVDYKSKADMRRKELEELRKRSLAKAEGTKIDDMMQTTFLFLIDEVIRC